MTGKREKMGGNPWDRATALETRATEDGGKVLITYTITATATATATVTLAAAVKYNYKYGIVWVARLWPYQYAR